MLTTVGLGEAAKAPGNSSFTSFQSFMQELHALQCRAARAFLPAVSPGVLWWSSDSIDSYWLNSRMLTNGVLMCVMHRMWAVAGSVEVSRRMW
jgi:hypothetical protein